MGLVSISIDRRRNDYHQDHEHMKYYLRLHNLTNNRVRWGTSLGGWSKNISDAGLYDHWHIERLLPHLTTDEVNLSFIREDDTIISILRVLDV